VVTPGDIIKSKHDTTPFRKLTEEEYRNSRDRNFDETTIDAIFVFADSRDVMLGFDDISGGNHVFETIVLCDDAAFLPLATYHTIDAIFVFADSRDWAGDQQIILDLLMSKNGRLGQ
jgi:hypothetical protein